MCCPDADHKERKEERKPNPNPAGGRIMRLQLTVNFQKGMRRCNMRQRKEEIQRSKWGRAWAFCVFIRSISHAEVHCISASYLDCPFRHTQIDNIFIVLEFQRHQLNTVEALERNCEGSLTWHWDHSTAQLQWLILPEGSGNCGAGTHGCLLKMDKCV